VKREQKACRDDSWNEQGRHKASQKGEDIIPARTVRGGQEAFSRQRGGKTSIWVSETGRGARILIVGMSEKGHFLPARLQKGTSICEGANACPMQPNLYLDEN